MPLDPRSMASQLQLLQSVADKFNPLQRQLNPLAGTEGARGGGTVRGTIIKTDDGRRINITEAPKWNDFHQRYYADGYRWINTKQKFSGVGGLHNFKSFEVESEE